jgi:hypothetical protein
MVTLTGGSLWECSPIRPLHESGCSELITVGSHGDACAGRTNHPFAHNQLQRADLVQQEWPEQRQFNPRARNDLISDID